jgi:nicotinamide-nucleotide amidase
MIVEIITTGTELLLGRILNTHQQWLSRRLADMGYEVARQVSVADTGPVIAEAAREALGRSDAVVITGGLGPTSDDLTRDYVAKLLGRNLREDETVMANIRTYFDERKRHMPEAVRVQALVPEGAIVLANPHGTAPGLAMELRPNPFRNGERPALVIMLPGPPRELRPMFIDSAGPLLRRVLPPQSEFVCRTLRTTGIGESLVQEKIAPRLEASVSAGLEVGYCARPWQVDVRLSARGAEAEKLVSEAEAIVRAKIGSFVFGAGDEEPEAVIIGLLTERKETLALAESCTGGCVAHRLTNVPGASAVLLAGLVTYSNEAKQKFLGVKAETLARHGAVSEAVAIEMAEGARRETKADYALSVTGIAGPSGGSPEKPVGTVFIGLAGPFPTVAEKHFNPYDRETFKDVTANQAFELLRRRVGPKALTTNGHSAAEPQGEDRR